MKIFCSYSHKDRDLKEQLEEHLSVLAGKISTWSDSKITAGTEFDPEIRRELDEAEIILLLLSSSYFHSAYCWQVEAQRALERDKEGRTKVIPILMRDCYWQATVLQNRNVVPSDLRPVASWGNRDEALKEITIAIDRVIAELSTGPELSVNTHPNTIVHNPDATFRCVLEYDRPIALRGMGLTELLPDLVLRFRGDPGDRRIADIRLIVNTNVTSRLRGSGMTESTLSLATGQCVTRLPTLGRGVQGRTVAANALAFLHVPLHELRLLDPSERNLRIANVRVNADQLLGSSVESEVAVVVAVTVSDTTVEPSSSRIAIVRRDFEFGVAGVDLGAERRLSRGQDMNAELVGSTKFAPRLSAILRFSGMLASYESAGERTRLIVQFHMVSMGISLFVTTEQVSSLPSGLSAILIQADVTGNGPSKARERHGYTEFKGRSFALSHLDMVAGTAHAVWELEGISTDNIQDIEVGVVIAYQSKPESQLPSIGTILVSGDLAPLSTIHTADSMAPIPRFAWSSSPIELCSITG